MYIAHSPPNKGEDPHYLSEHTSEVVRMAIEFSESFDPLSIAQVGALMHDQGKKSDEFQEYIQSDSKERGRVKHAIGGAIVLNNLKDEQIDQGICIFICLIVMGHHAGLSNLTKLKSKLQHAPDELQAIGVRTKEEEKRAIEILRGSMDNFNINPQEIDLNWYLSTLVRFCFSAVIDADWLDTEAYFNQRKSDMRYYKAPSMTSFLEKLDHYMKEMQKDASPSTLNTIRKQVYVKASQFGLRNDTFFALHAPTGSGKTLSSLSFALNHAKEYEKRGIIFALPLTNVTEQTSAIYRSILGAEHLVEHHSQVELDDTSEEMGKKRLATENWDRPFIVTTTVQLFESLFGNQPGQTRKLHRIANSVIVLDEYQKLPLYLLKPILSMLKILREQFDVTVLFMSATPLALEQSRALEGVGQPVEILKQSRDIFKKMQRVTYEQIKQPLKPIELVAKMKNYESVLCIVNTRKDAQNIFKAFSENGKHWDKVYHLSTTMCSAHRLNVIEEIKALTSDPHNDKSIAVVSTQILEVGVDLNFDAVFRMYGPLDSIIQAAGRCNREWELEKGTVYLFDLMGSGSSPGSFYAQATEQTKQLLNQVGVTALQDPDECIRYFRKVYSNTGENGLDRHQIRDEKLFEFQQVAKDFKMIDNEANISVLCAGYPDFPQNTLDQDQFSRSWYRKMQPYMIPLSERLVRTKNLEKVNGLYVWHGSYDAAIGYEL